MISPDPCFEMITLASVYRARIDEGTLVVMESIRIYIVAAWTKVVVGRLERDGQSGEIFKK